MSNDEPPPGQPPEDDPFLKKPQGPPASDGPGGADSPYGTGAPYAGGSGTPPPPPPPGSGPYGGDPYGGSPGSPYGGPDPLAGMPPLAPFGKRLAARVIDVLIIAIPLAILSLGVGGFDWSSDGGDEWDDFTREVNTGRQWLWSLISVIAYVGYDTLMTRKRGQTLGKRWMGLRVAMLNDGAVPDSNASLLRAAVLWLPALLCCFCIWWIAIIVSILVSKPYKQGLHDKAARTVVVSMGEDNRSAP